MFKSLQSKIINGKSTFYCAIFPYGKLKNDSSMEIQIEGCVDVSENPLPVDDFYNKFIEWIESNGWYFGGGIKSYM